MIEDDDRREFTRYPLRAFAELDNSSQQWTAHVLDISSQGARIALLDEHNFSAGDSVRFNIELPAKKNPGSVQLYLHLKGVIAHRNQHILGISYEPATDIDVELLKSLLTDFE